VTAPVKSKLTRLLSAAGPLFGLAFVVLLFALNPKCPAAFTSFYNVKTIITQTVIVGIGALGMTLVIIGGGIDLSVGSQVALSTVVTAWGLNTLGGALEAGTGATLGAALLGIVMLGWILIVVMKEFLTGKEEQVESGPNKALSSEALWLGLLGTAFGVLPVILANRYVIFQDYSHYALPASLAGVTLLIGLVNSIVFPRLRFGLMLGLVAVASLTHYAVSVNALIEEQAIQQFWWEMDWRVPGIKPGTTLIINYPTSNIGDDGNAGRNALEQALSLMAAGEAVKMIAGWIDSPPQAEDLLNEPEPLSGAVFVALDAIPQAIRPSFGKVIFADNGISTEDGRRIVSLADLLNSPLLIR